MKCIISSLHTCSINALLRDYCYPDTILSFDSHLDTFFYTDYIHKIIPTDKIRYAVGNPCTHMTMKLNFPDTQINLVVPNASIEAHAGHIENRMVHRMLTTGETGADIGVDDRGITTHDVIDMIKQFGLGLILSPPKDPVSLAKNDYGDLAIDIDADYFMELQDECYTSLLPTGVQRNRLGNLERVLKLIKKTKPEVITFSESRLECLNNPNSKTNYFLHELERIGYETENFFLYDSDEEVLNSLKIAKELDAAQNVAVSGRRISDNTSNSNSFMEDMRIREKAVKEFFIRKQLL